MNGVIKWKAITFCIPREDKEKVQELVLSGKYVTASDFYRQAIKRALERET